MKIDKTFIKRRYFETRAGITVISPAITASTLIGVAFLYIQDMISIFVFIPIFLVTMITISTIIGFKFRGIQLSTDEDMKYEKQRELNKTLYQIMLALDNGNMGREFYQRMKFVDGISKS